MLSSLFFLHVLLVATLTITLTHACKHIEVTSSSLGTVRFRQIWLPDYAEYVNSWKKAGGGKKDPSLSFDSGRPAYVSESGTDDPLYFYHARIDDPSSRPSSRATTNTATIGRWIVNRELGVGNTAMAYIDSWAITPYLVSSAADHAYWLIPSATVSGEWDIDLSFQVQCVDPKGDTNLYFEGSPLHQPQLTGFYVRRYLTASASAKTGVYSHVKPDTEAQQQYLFKVSRNWLIGAAVGVDSGLSFITDEAEEAHLMQGSGWKFVVHNKDGANGWTLGDSTVRLYTRGDHRDLYSSLHYHRSIKPVVRPLPKKQQYLVLRNGLPMPSLGLGTGGIWLDEGTAALTEYFRTAMDFGYRLFDMAREYGNEGAMGGVLKGLEMEHSDPRKQAADVDRASIFIQSKVWPTQLGFEPTTRAVNEALKDLKTSYIDMFMLHWPACNKAISWHHCETTEDPAGTWEGSWRAMEKLYAEGRILSLGVSNFDLSLLQQLDRMSIVGPHLVQNFAEPGKLDLHVRDFCHHHNITYQPYASMRNINALSSDLLHTLSLISSRTQRSMYDIVVQFFLQTGASMIPRTSQESRLLMNMDLATDWTPDEFLTSEEMQDLGWPGLPELGSESGSGSEAGSESGSSAGETKEAEEAEQEGDRKEEEAEAKTDAEL